MRVRPARKLLELLTVENAETGEQSYRCVRAGPDRFSLAFTYALLAAERNAGYRAWMAFFRHHSPWIA